MYDDLTTSTANGFDPKGQPMVLKYIPYGDLRSVIPYLARRAVENKAVLGGEGTGAQREANMAWKELKARFGLGPTPV